MPGPDPLLELNRLLGGLEASMRDVRSDIADVSSKADQSRAIMHRRLDEALKQIGDVKFQVRHIDGRMTAMAERIAAVEVDIKTNVMPTVVEVRAWKQRGIGALALAGMAGGAIMAFVYAFWQEIIAKITRTG